MEDRKADINGNYERFYSEIKRDRVYPTEFVVRTFLAQYPGLTFLKPQPGQRILDVAFGDGRNTIFLCEIGLLVSGVEITDGIVDQTVRRLERLGLHADLRAGRNSQLPYDDSTFDYILASHCIYYCDDNEVLKDNLVEYSRVLKPNGFIIASVGKKDSYIFNDAEELADGSMLIKSDPYANRNGYRLFGFNSVSEIQTYFSPYFGNFSFGLAENNYYGIDEKVFWVVCQKV
jgi:ubiquinone/menaquinone biosynthesis C-methylase UbiE